MLCAAHEAVMEASSREAAMVVGGFSLCEGCAGDALAQIASEAESFSRWDQRRTPEQIVADEIARCAERGFL